MPRQVKETTIDGIRYSVLQMGADTGGELVFRLGMPLLALVGSATLSKDTARMLSQSLSPADFNWAIGHFRECTKVYVVDKAAGPDKNGSPRGNWFPLDPIYIDHFAGAYGRWLNWLKFVAEVNFGDFFAASGASLPSEKASSASPSQTIVDGFSGDSLSPPG
jgi:hypothetical protein